MNHTSEITPAIRRRRAHARQRNLAHYLAAVAEFDRLWETGAAGMATERMDALLDMIQEFERDDPRLA